MAYFVDSMGDELKKAIEGALEQVGDNEEPKKKDRKTKSQLSKANSRKKSNSKRKRNL